MLSLKKEHGALGVKYHVSGLLDFDVEVNVPGKFSVYNSLTAIAICHHFNVDKKAIGEALHHVSVKGRIEIVPVTKRYTLMIDYAHNAMALESLLTTLKEYEPGRLYACLAVVETGQSHAVMRWERCHRDLQTLLLSHPIIQEMRNLWT